MTAGVQSFLFSFSCGSYLVTDGQEAVKYLIPTLCTKYLGGFFSRRLANARYCEATNPSRCAAIQ